MGFTLGLDLGANSIGWAIINHDSENKPCALLSCGARIFTEAVDAKTRTPKNQARRAARAARRLLDRRKRRKEKVLNILVRNKLLPDNKNERERLFAGRDLDPYNLRKRALDESLEPFTLGRALYHLSQRRGFQSNRKAKSKDDGMVASEINSLRERVKALNCRTLGEYLAGQQEKRNIHTDRAMYQEEFEAIWEAQSKFNATLLNTPLKIALHNAIFFQRPLRLQKNLVGKCTFEPSRKRAPRALLESERFRILQDISNLAVKDPLSREYRSLHTEERQKLIDSLENQKSLAWGKARKLLNLHGGELFNLEEGGKKLVGNRTACDLRAILGKSWESLGEEAREGLITDILTIDNEEGFLDRMNSHWGFDNETAEGLAKTELVPGYMRLSRKAICRILPHLETLEPGMTYDKACLEAGYNHSAPVQGRIVKKLGEPPQLRNPVVQKALFEVRKLVNAIIRKFGKPAVVRIEMARDMKLTRRQLGELKKEQRAREKSNEISRKILELEFGIQNPSRADIQKYQLWQECGAVCPYTGTVISREMLFSPEVDVEHILPYSRTLDDSYMNKTLCMASENRSAKHNRTPYEAYHADEKRYLEEILVRVNSLPYPKRRRFEQKEIDTDKFIERQLNDTRYICVEVKKYIEQLGAAVEVTKGEATAALRRRWDLNRVLSEDGEKNRSDHRHHAVDAIIVALTSRPLFQTLSRLSGESGASLSERGFCLEKPWPSFFTEACEKVNGIIVSHSSRRKIADALHMDTAYGFLEKKGCFACRKPLQALSSIKQVESIGDATVRRLVMKRLDEHGGDFKKAFAEPLLHFDRKTPIKNVRLHATKSPSSLHSVKRDGKAYKFFELQNNHHVEIIENVNTGERKGVFVTTIEAARRARIEHTAIVKRDHGPEWRLTMSLCINDMVEFEVEGVKRYYRVQKMSGPYKITLSYHAVADSDDADKGSIFTRSPGKLNCRKVTIDCLGDVLPCNDIRPVADGNLSGMLSHAQDSGDKQSGQAFVKKSPDGGGS